jgi:hypothetical protein
MSAYVDRARQHVNEAEEGLARHLAAQRRQWHYRVERGRVWFDAEVERAHRRLRQSIPAYIRNGSILSLLLAPVIYSLIVPFVVLDAWVCLYQRVCFPIYGIPRVSRRAYFVLDRHTLSYLNGIEKMNCTYCSYANGLLAFVREVAARTEQYWCPIKHARAIPDPHDRYQAFFDFGDAEAYRRGLPAIRRAVGDGGGADAPRR